jgi:hypothetical protein
MNPYDYSSYLHSIWQDAVQRYQNGHQQLTSFFSIETIAELAAIGLKPIEVYDFVEDFVKTGEPDFSTFLLVCEARRDYFLHVQKGVPSPNVIAMASLPAKDEAIDEIVWLPRILTKAMAKLRGEMEPDLMYGCSGDRNFLKESQIHPAEFLRAVWAWSDNPTKIVNWVKQRRSGQIVSAEPFKS